MPSRYDDVWSLSVRRGFLWPAVDIYGGFSGFYDYGHLGAAMKRNWEELWLEAFLGLDANYHLIDTTIALPEAALKASGHVDHFTDLLVRCGKCKETYRSDHLLEDVTHEAHEGLQPAEADARIKELNVRCPKCKGELAPSQPFNMMFPLAVGPLGADRGYLRPETAQGAYLNFKREFEALRRRLPVGLAIIGRCFRNEISPRQGTYRMREFLQAELQIFFDPATWDAQVPFDSVAAKELHVAFADEKGKGAFAMHAAKDLVARGLPRFYVYHMAVVQDFYLGTLAVPPDRFRFAELSEKERAFYNKVHFDIELKQDSIGGFKEVGGVHYRTDHDLGGHQAASKERLEVSVDGRKVLPHVLELSFGVDRNLWAALDLAYATGEKTVLRLPPRLAPIPVAVFPLMAKDGLDGRASALHARLRRRWRAFYDEGGSIGKRYARMDEVGTPFCVTVDHQTMQDGTVTVRERDSTAQQRVAEERLEAALAAMFAGERAFAPP
ncbi:MAG: glycine--tRNA ligase [Candidatus Thermoplasmatota archaeon]